MATMRTWFSRGRGLEYLGVATKDDLYQNIGDIDMWTAFRMLKIKVSLFFSPRWVSRYVGTDVRWRPCREVLAYITQGILSCNPQRPLQYTYLINSPITCPSVDAVALKPTLSPSATRPFRQKWRSLVPSTLHAGSRRVEDARGVGRSATYVSSHT